MFLRVFVSHDQTSRKSPWVIESMNQNRAKISDLTYFLAMSLMSDMDIA